MSDDPEDPFHIPADRAARIVDKAVAHVERHDHHCYRIRTDAYAPARVIGGLEYPEVRHEIEGILCAALGPPCMQCGDVSEVLCDFPLPEENRTCDRPLCLRCAPTIGADKNYCAEHIEGHGLLLFRRALRTDELAAKMEENRRLVKRRPRLPAAPPMDRRWRVMDSHSAGPRALTGWIAELDARRFAKESTQRYVETWAEYVEWHRRTYPRPPRKR